jgi:hypothetical protein
VALEGIIADKSIEKLQTCIFSFMWFLQISCHHIFFFGGGGGVEGKKLPLSTPLGPLQCSRAIHRNVHCHAAASIIVHVSTCPVYSQNH